MAYCLRLTGLALTLVISGCTQESEPPTHSFSGSEVQVYLTKSIITMDAVRPRANVVAVDGDRIAAVGNMADVERALRGQRARWLVGR